ncbi:MAG: GNAT family N-acetyltransferase, partial [Clostridia bacterium]|nr:GNAT family N-acetyltransferase [Clostridia bacterium]
MDAKSVDRAGRREEIRLLDERDLRALTAMERVCFSLAWSERTLQRELEAEGALPVGLFWDDKLAAYALLRDIAGEAELLRIGVAPGLRQQGAGARLLTRALELVRERGCARVFLEVRESNGAARR